MPQMRRVGAYNLATGTHPVEELALKEVRLAGEREDAGYAFSRVPQRLPCSALSSRVTVVARVRAFS
jgi:hypothetical protein